MAIVAAREPKSRSPPKLVLFEDAPPTKEALTTECTILARIAAADEDYGDEERAVGKAHQIDDLVEDDPTTSTLTLFTASWNAPTLVWGRTRRTRH